MAERVAESSSSNTSSTRPLVAVTAIDGEETIAIAFSMMGKERKMLRPKGESLEKTLKRIALSAVNRKDKNKVRRGRGEESPVSSPVVRLIKGKEDVLGTMPTVQAWQVGDQLIVGEERYTVVVNLPTVKSFSLSAYCIAGGYPIVPEAELQFSDSAHCLWTWKRLPIDSSSNPTNVSSSMVYWTDDSDLGHRLELECIPRDHNGRSGEPISVITAPVRPSPSLSAITLRHRYTQQCVSQDELRVVSYNILAEYYSSTDYAKQVLYPYCQPDALLITYRQCLLARELIGYHADILCLQEVGKKCFEKFLLPVMRDSGYDGWFAQKTGQVLEGEALFYRCSKFKVMNTSSVSLTQFLIEDKSCSELYSALQKAPTVMNDLQKMHTILQTSVLQSIDCPSRYLCVANTHLYFHPAADHIRLIQAVISAKALYKTKKEFMESLVGAPEVAVIFCGDFNSCPCIGAYEFLTKGSLGRDHQDWTKYKLGLIPKCGCASVPENESMYIPSLHMRQLLQNEIEQPVGMHILADDIPAPHLCAEITDEFTGLDINHSLSLQDAYGTHLILPYTNFTLGFKCVLDYIFTDSDQLLVTRAIPLPSQDELTENVALPSVSFPSDHLALIADLKWKTVTCTN